MQKISVFWFRRDLRLTDNTALKMALESGHPVLPIFIFDTEILGELPENDARVSFIHQILNSIHLKFLERKSGLRVFHSSPLEAFQTLFNEYQVHSVFVNRDYEPYARQRDAEIEAFAGSRRASFLSFKDQVVFHENDVLKPDGKPYTVFTPYSKKWLQLFAQEFRGPVEMPGFEKLLTTETKFPTLEEIGFKNSEITVKNFNLSQLDHYSDVRNLPSVDATSYLSPHLRFGTIGIRELISQLKPRHESFLNELIWREFFMQILFHFPKVVHENFHNKYNGIEWRNNANEFALWCEGKTGYPMVDAGMRQLNATGYMHNRVRMVVASFLCKHLLIDWRWGENYFAQKLLDFELSANNGNWQWAAGTGCDAAPYFRVFNPTEQQKKFDEKFIYIRRWIPEFDDFQYPKPMVDHKMARERALDTYKTGLLKGQ